MSDTARDDQSGEPAPGFLGRVIDAAFERASPLEPRLPSLFEPRPAALAWPAQAADGDDTRAVFAHVEVPLERETHRQAHPSALTSPGDAPVRRERAVDQRPPAALGVRAPVEAAPAVMSHQGPQAAPVAARPPSPSGQEPERNILAPTPIPMAIELRRAGRPVTADEPRHPALDAPRYVLRMREVTSKTEPTRGPARMAEGPEGPPRSAERSERLPDHPMSQVPVAQRVVVEPPTVRHRPEPAPFNAAFVTHDPEPVVNVTIGRIEVRAVPPQPGATRPRSQGPTPLSLEDYLKQRGGER